MLSLVITTIVMEIMLAASVFFIIRGFLSEPDPRIKAIGGCLIALAALIAIGVYSTTGNYGQPDAPLAGREDEIIEARIKQQTIKTRSEQNLEIARNTVRNHPDDIVALFSLAEAAAANGDFVLEIETLKSILALLDTADKNEAAGVKSLIAEAVSREAGGLVTARAFDWVEDALADNPDDIRARYLKGLYFSQSGDDDTALATWAPLARDVAGTEIAPSVERAITAAATRLGVDAAGFLPEDTITEADIGAMVASLEARLLELDSVIDHEDWEMLIRSHTVLGNTSVRDARIRDLLDRMEGDSTDPVSDSRLLMAVVQIVLPADNLPATIPPVVNLLLARARELTPDAPAVLFFSGLVAHHHGDTSDARKYWEPLIIRLEDGNSLRAAIEQQLKEAAP